MRIKRVNDRSLSKRPFKSNVKREQSDNGGKGGGGGETVRESFTYGNDELGCARGVAGSSIGTRRSGMR